MAWAFASVVAHEYPNLYAELGAYGLATGISLARVLASQHFLSDVFVGGLIGYQVGHQIYKTRHNPQLDDDLAIVARQTTAPRPDTLASPYVPLDSWVYPAIERLAVGRYFPMPFMGLWPWTQMNCARMVAGLNQRLQGNLALPPEMNAIRQALTQEFSDELSVLEGKPYESIRLDTMYTRITGIAGLAAGDAIRGDQPIPAARYISLHQIAGPECFDWQTKSVLGPEPKRFVLMSNNPEPFWMLRIDQTEPLYIPGVSKVFGPFRLDNFLASCRNTRYFRKLDLITVKS